MSVVINGTRFYRLADGTSFSETLGNGLFSVDSHYANRIEFWVEDGGGENTIQEFGFEFSSGNSTYWHFAMFRGYEDKIINNEVHTFSVYDFGVPNQILGAVRRLPNKDIKVAFRQVYGDKILGNENGEPFDSVSLLQSTYPANEERYTNLNVAYVLDGSSTGFYQVAFTSPSTYTWTKQSQSLTVFGQIKGYNLGIITVQPSLTNPQGTIPIVITETEAFMQLITNLGVQLDNFQTIVDELLNNSVQAVEDTPSVDLVLEDNTVGDGLKLKANVKVSEEVNNRLSIKEDGVFVSPTDFETNSTRTVDTLVEEKENDLSLIKNEVRVSVFGNWEIEAQLSGDVELPATRFGSVQVGNKIYIIGGLEMLWDGDNYGWANVSNKLISYDIDTKTYAVEHEFDKYYGFSNNAVSYNPNDNCIYVFNIRPYLYGGRAVGGGARNDISEKPFKISLDDFEITELSSPYVNENERLEIPNGSVYYDGKFYISYGIKKTYSAKEWEKVETTDFFEYSDTPITINSSISITTAGAMESAYPSANYENGTVAKVLYSGTTNYFRVKRDSTDVKSLTINIYDVDTNTWSLGATPPTPSGGTEHQQGTSVLVGDKIYVKRSNLSVLYNITANTWATLATPIIPNVHHENPIYHDDYIYYGGGWVSYTQNGFTGSTNSGVVQRYHISTNEWELHSTLPKLMNEQQGYGALFIKDDILYYAFGYSDEREQYVNQVVYKYDLTTPVSYGVDENLIKTTVDGIYVSKDEIVALIHDEAFTNIATTLSIELVDDNGTLKANVIDQYILDLIGGSVVLDNETITRNGDDELQSVALKGTSDTIDADELLEFITLEFVD